MNGEMLSGRTGKSYPLTLTSFSQCFVGLTYDDRVPAYPEDIIVEIGAITCSEKDGTIHGFLSGVFAPSENVGSGPFDIHCYAETRNPPYYCTGYGAKRTLKNARLIGESFNKGEDIVDRTIQFTAEADTGWEEIDFTYEDMS